MDAARIWGLRRSAFPQGEVSGEKMIPEEAHGCDRTVWPLSSAKGQRDKPERAHVGLDGHESKTYERTLVRTAQY